MKNDQMETQFLSEENIVHESSSTEHINGMRFCVNEYKE
jgi:hypothetical protein